MENNRWFWARKDCTQYWRASRPPIQRLEAKHWSVAAPRSNQAAISGTLSVEVIPCQVLGVGISLDQTRSFKQGSKPIEDKRLVLTCFGYVFEKAKPAAFWVKASQESANFGRKFTMKRQALKTCGHDFKLLKPTKWRTNGTPKSHTIMSHNNSSPF